MNANWVEVTVGDLGKVITGKTPPTSEKKYFDGDYKFVSPKDLEFDSRYIKSTQTTITTEAISKFKNQVIPKNTVMFTALSYGFGKLGIADSQCLTNQQINSIVVNDEYYDFSFVYYLLRNSKDYFLTFNAGIVTPIVPKSTFSKIKVFVPKSKTTQQKIARILSAYDDLIENNLKRIKLLEEMAQITYEEWFVRMKFPGHENTPVDAETGLPEGWHEKPLETLATFLNGFAFKPDQLGDSGLPVIKIKELKGGVVGDTPRNSGAEIPDKYIVNTGDILFSWSGSLEVVLWQYEKGLLNQHLFKVKPNSDIPSSFMYLSLASCLPFFENLTTGATMKHIKRKELSFVKAIVPDCKLLKEFDQQVSPILKSILNLNEQNQKLKEARDILLPRLMTGMIDVDQLEFPDIEVNEARNCC